MYEGIILSTYSHIAILFSHRHVLIKDYKHCAKMVWYHLQAKKILSQQSLLSVNKVMCVIEHLRAWQTNLRGPFTLNL